MGKQVQIRSTAPLFPRERQKLPTLQRDTTRVFLLRGSPGIVPSFGSSPQSSSNSYRASSTHPTLTQQERCYIQQYYKHFPHMQPRVQEHSTLSSGQHVYRAASVGRPLHRTYQWCVCVCEGGGGGVERNFSSDPHNNKKLDTLARLINAQQGYSDGL